MTLWKKIFIGLGTLLLLFMGAIGLIIYNLPDLCANTILAEHSSPNGELKAVIFDRDCGTTTDFSTQVSILPTGRSLENDGGNAFVSDTNHGHAPSWRSGGPEVRFNWISDTSAVISHHQFARAFRAEAVLKGVQITYETFQ